jgi:hypothetical protein
VKTIRGTVESSWTHDANGVTLHVHIPAGADARVMLPRPKQLSGITVEENGRMVWENGEYMSGDPGITGAMSEDNDIAFDVGSGEYTFTLRGK